MTLTDVIQEVHARMGLLAQQHNEPRLATHPAHEPVLTSFIEDGATQLAADTHSIEMVATVAVEPDQATYPLPEGIRKVLKAVLSLPPADTKVIMQLDHIGGATAANKWAVPGATSWFGIFGQILHLAPTPTTAGTLTLYCLADSALTGDEGERVFYPSVRRPYQKAVIAFACSEWAGLAGLYDLSSSLRLEYAKIVSDATNPLRPDTARARYRSFF